MRVCLEVVTSLVCVADCSSSMLLFISVLSELLLKQEFLTQGIEIQGISWSLCMVNYGPRGVRATGEMR